MANVLSVGDVEHVASLARLELTDSETEKMRGQLNDILGQFTRLQELDTASVPPTSHSLQMRNVFRDDVVRPSLPREEAIRNAPEKRAGSFIVPQVLDI